MKIYVIEGTTCDGTSWESFGLFLTEERADAKVEEMRQVICSCGSPYYSVDVYERETED